MKKIVRTCVVMGVMLLLKDAWAEPEPQWALGGGIGFGFSGAPSVSGR